MNKKPLNDFLETIKSKTYEFCTTEYDLGNLSCETFYDLIIKTYENDVVRLANDVMKHQSYKGFFNKFVREDLTNIVINLAIVKDEMSNTTACECVEKLNARELVKEAIRLKSIPLFQWVASSNDGAFEDKSDAFFKSAFDCYNDMRDNALNKMKWNTNLDEDFDDMPPNTYIGYEVKFFRDKIIHSSYSGTYTYKIELV